MVFRIMLSVLPSLTFSPLSFILLDDHFRTVAAHIPGLPVPDGYLIDGRDPAEEPLGIGVAQVDAAMAHW